MKKRLFSIVISMLLLMQIVMPCISVAETIDKKVYRDVSVSAQVYVDGKSGSLKNADTTN